MKKPIAFLFVAFVVSNGARSDDVPDLPKSLRSTISKKVKTDEPGTRVLLREIQTCKALIEPDPKVDDKDCKHLLIGPKHAHGAKQKKEFDCDFPPFMSSTKFEQFKSTLDELLKMKSKNNFGELLIKKDPDAIKLTKQSLGDAGYDTHALIAEGRDTKKSKELLEWYNWYKANCPDKNPSFGGATVIDMVNYHIAEDLSEGGASCRDIVTSAISPILLYLPDQESFMMMSMAWIFYKIHADDLKKLIPMWADFKRGRGNPITLFGNPSVNSKEAAQLGRANILAKLGSELDLPKYKIDMERIRALIGNPHDSELFLKAGSPGPNHPWIIEMNKSEDINRMPPSLSERAKRYFELSQEKIRQKLRPVSDLVEKGRAMARTASAKSGIRVVPMAEFQRSLSPTMRSLFSTLVPVGSGILLTATYTQTVMEHAVGYGTNIEGERIFFSDPDTICEEYSKGRMPGLEQKIPLLLQLKMAIDLNQGTSAPVGGVAPQRGQQ